MDLSNLTFNVRDGFCILAGAEVEKFLHADKIAHVPRSEFYADCFESEALCRWQAEMHGRGFCAVMLSKGDLGWSVRYRSGLDNFAVLASVRDGDLNGTFLDALMYAREWQKKDPTKRFVVAKASTIFDPEIETFKAVFLYDPKPPTPHVPRID